MIEKETRLKVQEKEVRLRMEEMEAERRKFGRDRDHFARNLEAREAEVSARKRDMERKWPDNSVITGLEPSHPAIHPYQIP